MDRDFTPSVQPGCVAVCPYWFARTGVPVTKFLIRRLDERADLLGLIVLKIPSQYGGERCVHTKKIIFLSLDFNEAVADSLILHQPHP